MLGARAGFPGREQRVSANMPRHESVWCVRDEGRARGFQSMMRLAVIYPNGGRCTSVTTLLSKLVSILGFQFHQKSDF